jgi:hypothetical protein
MNSGNTMNAQDIKTRLRAASRALFGPEATFPTKAAKRLYTAIRAEGTTQEDALEYIAERYQVSLDRTYCVKGTAAQENAWRVASIARTSTNRN